jgi:hypothetical protein
VLERGFIPVISGLPIDDEVALARPGQHPSRLEPGEVRADGYGARAFQLLEERFARSLRQRLIVPEDSTKVWWPPGVSRRGVRRDAWCDRLAISLDGLPMFRRFHRTQTVPDA